MSKQTAVEWLFQELWNRPKDRMVWHHILEKAKEMEKKQMEDVWEDSRVEDFGKDYIGKQISFNDYFNETFKTKNND